MRSELRLFQPHPGTVYSLEVTCDLTGARRHSILRYYRQGLIEPMFLPPFGMMAFDVRAIRAIRRIEWLRAEFELNLPAIKMIVGLMEELDRLRAELRFWRGR
jgi:DNA-binding transcriptional MerR regulator